MAKVVGALRGRRVVADAKAELCYQRRWHLLGRRLYRLRRRTVRLGFAPSVSVVSHLIGLYLTSRVGQEDVVFQARFPSSGMAAVAIAAVDALVVVEVICRSAYRVRHLHVVWLPHL